MLASGLNGQTKAVGPELDKDTIVRAYARWAPVYDLVFGAVFEQGRRAAIGAAARDAVLRDYTTEAMQRATIGVYREVLAGRREARHGD